MEKRVSSCTGLRQGVVPVVVLLVAVLAVACGSGSSSGSAKGPAGAKENATSTAICRDITSGAPVAACAENTIGPGGGVVFYDAGGPQSWGRFLEVAPWNWNPQLAPTEAYACPGGCGATASFLNPATDRTQDGGKNSKSDTFDKPDRYMLCTGDGNQPLTGLFDGGGAARTGTAIGVGRANTALLLGQPPCANAGSGQGIGAVNLVVSYRGGGLADWYLPSKDELDRLYRFGNRNAVGGFTASEQYVSSSIPHEDAVWAQEFGKGATADKLIVAGGEGSYWLDVKFLVRPIRAFS